MKRYMSRLEVLTIVVGLGVSANALALPDLGIDTQAEYDAFTDAIRATEYVRDDLIVERKTRRVIPAIAALAAYAERNPLATPEQLFAFVSRYDRQLETVRAVDPEFRRPASVAIAVREAFVIPDGGLVGTDTDVADDVFGLLGISITSFGEPARDLRRRMMRFEEATSARPEFRAEFPEVLTCVLTGVRSDGETHPGLADAADRYLTNEGFAPMLGAVDPSRPAINAEIAGLPTFEEFQTLDPVALRDSIVADLQAIQAAGRRIISSLPDQSVSSTAISDTLDLSDPALEAAYQAAEAAYRARMSETSADRARALASSLLLSQGGFGAISDQAGGLNDFATLQLDSNSTYAAFETGATIGLGALAIAEGYATGSPLTAVAGLAVIGSESAGLAGFSSGPDLGDIADMLGRLSTQLEDTRVQLNGRFDVVDLQLNATYNAMTTGLSQIISLQITTQDGIDDVLERTFQLQSQLSRLETSLFALGDASEVLDLEALAARFLEYRFNTAVDLGFIEYSNVAREFATFVESTATSDIFAGPSSPPIGLSQASDLFDFTSDSFTGTDELTSIGRYLNDLNEVPAGIDFAGPISLSAPRSSFWTQGAGMYVQFGRENPWYFASEYELQAAGENAPLDEIISEGERIVDLVTAARNPDLFAALTTAVRDAAESVQAEIDAVIFTELSKPEFNLARPGIGHVDPWGPSAQDVAPRLTPTVDEFDAPLANGAVFRTTDANNTTTNGWERISAVGGDRFDIAEEFATYYVTDHFEPTNWSSGSPPAGFPLGTTNRLEGRDDVVFQIRINDEYLCGQIELIFRASSQDANGRRWYIGRSIPADSGYVFQNTEFVPINMIAGASLGEIGPFLSFADRRFRTWNGGLWDVVETRLNSPSMPILPSYEMFNVVNEVRAKCDGGLSAEDFFYSLRVRGDQEFSVLRRERADMPGRFKIIRDALRPRIDQARVDTTSDLFAALEDLDDATALLDAYLTLAFDDYYRSSDVLRSAFRAAPGSSPLGIRSADVGVMFQQARLDDRGSLGGAMANDGLQAGAVDFDLVSIQDELDRRLDIIDAEIAEALNVGGPTFPYIEYTLAELRSLKRDALRLAVPDTYESGPIVDVPAAEGVLANDVRQLLVVDVVDGQQAPIFRDSFVDTGCSGGSCPDEIEITTSQGGTVTMNSNGGFGYNAPPEFGGIDTFSYRTWNFFDVPSAAVPSDPVDVRLVVTRACEASDIAAPFGVLDLADIDAFITGYSLQDPVVDIAPPFGVIDLGDIDAFVVGFLSGCDAGGDDPAPGIEIGVDFGPTPTANWNNVNASGAYDVIDLVGDPVDGATLTVSDGSFFGSDGADAWIGLSANGGDAPAAFVDSVTTDIGGTSRVPYRFEARFEGLPQGDYSLVATTATRVAIDRAETITINGDTVGAMTLDREDAVNSGAYFLFPSVSVGPDGVFDIVVTSDANNPVVSGLLLTRLSTP